MTPVPDTPASLLEQRLLQALIDNVPDQIYFKDVNSCFVRINPALARRYGLSDPAQAIGKSDADFYSASHAEQTRREELSIMRTGEGMHDHLHHEIWANGQETWNLSTKLRWTGPDGEVLGVFGISHDITAHKEREALIWRQAHFDSLTGLANRLHLRQQWEQMAGLANRRHKKVALLMLDLDHFKEVNDTLGHSAGDELIRDVARRIKGCIRASDVVARLGGDEFAVLLPDMANPMLAANVAQKILHALAQSFDLQGETVFVTASMGIAVYPSDGDTLDELFKYADQAMYLAKKQGRNRYSYYTADLELDARRRMRLGADLREALVNQEVFLHYQPVVGLKSGQVLKAEVLARWLHPSLGMVSPAEFIPVAESSGFIHELGDWVLETAMVQLSQWRAQGFEQLALSVNKSPVQMSRPSTQGQPLPARLAALNLPGHALTIEITEGVLMQPTLRIKDQISELRALGIGFAIDDFGTGYSSLSYLNQYDVQMLKIDRSFVSGLGQDDKSLALCKAIVGMAHALNMQVIAEGVETHAQNEMLRDIGCDYAQGFFHARPMDGRSFEQWMSQQA